MTDQTDFVQPSSVAVWLVTLFTRAEQAESILGDLMEEFSQLASKSGVASARRWFWRQAVKTIAHLMGAGLRSSPWSSAAAVVAGLLLIRFGFLLYGHLIEAILDTWVYRYLADLGRREPSRNVGAESMFWITRGTLIGRALVAMLAGSFVALAAKGREMTVTASLCLLMTALGIAQCLLMVATTGHYQFVFLWSLPTVFADSIPTVVGAMIVRMRRSAAAWPSAT